MAETGTTTHITGVGTVMVPVSDQDRAVEFYVEKLGFEKLSDTPYGDGARWIEVAPPGAETPVALVLPREGDRTGIDLHFAYTTDDVDAAHSELRARGVDVDADVMRMGDPVPPMFFARDQDRNSFLVVQRG
jgi:catechol 2,3-dioxygenase-like lactoylglutathione lyase family enzyme